MINQNFDKWTWTENDFDHMNFKMSQIFGISLDPKKFETAFDLDFVCQWMYAEGQIGSWVAPATLVFWNVKDLDFDVESYTLNN